MLTTTALTTTKLSPYRISHLGHGELPLSFPGVAPDIMDVAAVDAETGMSGHATGYLITQTLGNMPMAIVDGNDAANWDQSAYGYVMRGDWRDVKKVFEYIQWRRPGNTAYYYNDGDDIPLPAGVTSVTHPSQVHGVINMVWNSYSDSLSWVRELPLTRRAMVISTHHDYDLRCGAVVTFSPITQWYTMGPGYSAMQHVYAIYTMTPGTLSLTPSQVDVERQQASDTWYNTTLLPGIAMSVVPLWHLGPVLGARC